MHQYIPYRTFSKTCIIGEQINFSKNCVALGREKEKKLVEPNCIAVTLAPQTMKAVIFKGPHRVAVEERPIPTIQDPRDIIVKVIYTALCGRYVVLMERDIRCGEDEIMLKRESALASCMSSELVVYQLCGILLTVFFWRMLSCVCDVNRVINRVRRSS